jgi:predicted Zn-dependent peptidase
MLGYGRIYTAAETKRRLLQVTPAHLRSVAREFLRPDRANLALVSPVKAEEKLLGHLGL